MSRTGGEHSVALPVEDLGLEELDFQPELGESFLG